MPLPKNRVKELRKLAQKKYREEQGVFLVEGVRMTLEAVHSDYAIAEAFYTEGLMDDPAGRSLLESLRKKCPHIHLVSAREIEVLSDTITSQGIAALVRQKPCSTDALLHRNDTQSIVVALDGVSDPGNLGSIVRTCAWFGVNGIILGRNSVDLFNTKVIRGTMGGIFHVPVTKEDDLPATITNAKLMGYRVYVADQRGEAHFDKVQFARKSLIVFGNEAWGVSDQMKKIADVRVGIRKYGAAESLNVGVACGIVLSALHRLYDE